MSFKICLKIFKGVGDVYETPRYDLTKARYFSLTTVKLSYIVNEKSTWRALRNLLKSGKVLQKFKWLCGFRRRKKMPTCCVLASDLYGNISLGWRHKRLFTNIHEKLFFLIGYEDTNAESCKYSINEERHRDAHSEGMLEEQQQQEEKCRLAININFLINIRCHSERQSSTVTGRGLFQSSDVKKHSFPDSSATLWL